MSLCVRACVCVLPLSLHVVLAGRQSRPPTRINLQTMRLPSHPHPYAHTTHLHTHARQLCVCNAHTHTRPIIHSRLQLTTSLFSVWVVTDRSMGTGKFSVDLTRTHVQACLHSADVSPVTHGHVHHIYGRQTFGTRAIYALLPHLLTRRTEVDRGEMRNARTHSPTLRRTRVRVREEPVDRKLFGWYVLGDGTLGREPTWLFSSDTWLSRGRTRVETRRQSVSKEF